MHILQYSLIVMMMMIMSLVIMMLIEVRLMRIEIIMMLILTDFSVKVLMLCEPQKCDQLIDDVVIVLVVMQRTSPVFLHKETRPTSL